MRIFLGSSKEAKATMHVVAKWLKAAGHRPVPWDDRNVFRAGRTVWGELIRHSREVDGAIFIFAPDDETWKRDDSYQTTRDNVQLEYGLFAAASGAESVLCMRAGDTNIPTDLGGIVRVDIPCRLKESDPRRADVLAWAKRLRPRYFTSLAQGLTRLVFERDRTDVSALLGQVAERLAEMNSSPQIMAVCGDKGRYGKPYYGKQFSWVKKRRERTLRRIFIGSRKHQPYPDFPPNEVTGIVMHFDQEHVNIRTRWIYEDDDRVAGMFSSNLGFCIFGNGWLVHWGLDTGFCFDPVEHGTDYGFGRLLSERFEDLWNNASHFDEDLKRALREDSNTAKQRKRAK